jgi:phytoene synthase
MSRAAIAEMVAAGDPDRFAAAKLAGDRAWRLHALYAFNLEVARIPAAVSEPMLGEIRLQWWRDVIDEIFEGKLPRKHEVVEPLAELIRETSLPRAPFVALLDARAQDVHGLALADHDALLAYLDATSGTLMQLGALALGADARGGDVARQVGAATGLGLLIRALPALYALGADPVAVDALDRNALAEGRTPAPLAEALAALAKGAEGRLSAARAWRADVHPDAVPALVANWTATPVLHAAARPGFDLFSGAGLQSEFRKRLRLASQAIFNRW